jgi:response regulator RpfG family c-di-GMP phosphodiesterase
MHITMPAYGLRTGREAMAGKEHTPARAERSAPLTILVVASDLKLLKLLDMALSLEFACTVLTVESARRAEETAIRITPDLLILDEQLLDHNVADLGARLHRIAGLSQLPTLLLHVAAPSQDQSENQSYPIRSLGPSWKVEALYAAVQALLGQTL